MGSKKKAPEYNTTTVNTKLFGKTTTDKNGSVFTPKKFQKNLVKISQGGITNALTEYLNPNYESDEFKQADAYYTNKLNNTLQNNYLNNALNNNLLRGSTAADIMRGFGQNLANTEYERERQYRDDQLGKLQAALLGYNTIYDIAKGTTGLSNALANSISNYNLQKTQIDNANSGSGLGGILGGIGSIAGTAFGGPAGGALGGATGNVAGKII